MRARTAILGRVLIAALVAGPLAGACARVEPEPETRTVGRVSGSSWPPAIATVTKYFRDQTGPDEATLGVGYSRAWILDQMGEPPLSDLSGAEKEVYRLLVLPAFESPLCVRVERLGRRATVWRKEIISHTAEIAHDAPLQIVRRGMPWEEFGDLSHEFTISGFWNLGPKYLPQPDCTDVVLEGFKNGRYHVVSRCGPDQQTDAGVVQLERHLTELAMSGRGDR